MVKKKIAKNKKWFENLEFFLVWKFIKKNPKKFFMLLILDFVFLLCLVSINKIMIVFFPQNSGNILRGGIGVVWLALLVFFVLVVFSYSILKFMIMRNIKLFQKKVLFKFDRFWNFLFLNVLWFLMFAIILVIVAVIFVFSLKINILASIRTVILALLGVLFYLFINVSHVIYLKYPKVRLFGKSFDLVFSKFNKFLRLIVFDVVLIGILYLGYLVINSGVLMLVNKSGLGLGFLKGYSVILLIIAFVLFFALLLFNNIYLYICVNNIIDNRINKK